MGFISIRVADFLRWFAKPNTTLHIFSSRAWDRQYSSQIDFILARREDRRACLDCKVIPGECVVPQHKLVVTDFRFRVRAHRDKRAKIARTKWWKLRGEESQTFKERMLGEGPWKEGVDVDDMWIKMATCVWKVASEVFGVSRGDKQEVKETW
jgi:hypothetical protein